MLYRMSNYLASKAMAILFVGLAGTLACGGTEKKPEAPKGDSEPAILQDDRAPTTRRSRVPGQEDEGDDDENLQIEGLKGHLDPYDIQAGVEPHNGSLAKCFQANSKRKHFLGGEIELAFTVARDGSVKQVRVVKSSVGSWAIEHCLLEASVVMDFKKPKGGEADFSLPLDFEARRAANWWTEEKSDAELGELPKELLACQSESGAANPRNVWVTLYLGNRGVVQSVGFASPHKDGIAAEWADCAAAKVTAWTLSDPRGKIAKLSFRYNPE